MEDILDTRGENGDKQYLVKWENWDGADTWISAAHNPELRAFVTRNAFNPDSCKLNKDLLDLPKSCENTEILSLKQAIFDSLADVRYTPEGSIGHQSRITVKVPFSVKTFSETFRAKVHKISKDNGNVDCHLTVDEVSLVLGNDWISRGYKTSTQTYVSERDYIHLWWGYKARKQYSHQNCPRYCRYILARENNGRGGGYYEKTNMKTAF